MKTMKFLAKLVRGSKETEQNHMQLCRVNSFEDSPHFETSYTYLYFQLAPKPGCSTGSPSSRHERILTGVDLQEIIWGF